MPVFVHRISKAKNGSSHRNSRNEQRHNAIHVKLVSRSTIGIAGSTPNCQQTSQQRQQTAPAATHVPHVHSSLDLGRRPGDTDEAEAAKKQQRPQPATAATPTASSRNAAIAKQPSSHMYQTVTSLEALWEWCAPPLARLRPPLHAAVTSVTADAHALSPATAVLR